MLKTKLIHPIILEALARAGHGAKVLIADGDYPVFTTAGKNAEIVHLNLAPGICSSTDVLKYLLSVELFEGAAVMDVPEGRPDPEIWDEYKKMLKEEGMDLEFEKIERFAFYEAIKQDDVALIIQTGEIRDYANLLLTIASLN